MDPTITAGWIGAAGGLLGGAVGGGIAYVAAVKSLNKAAAQGKTAQREEWDEIRRRADEDRGEQRRAALLALDWELEVDQELLERQQQTKRRNLAPLLPHVALDAALGWYRSLPYTGRSAIHEAQVALVRYNVDAAHHRTDAERLQGDGRWRVASGVQTASLAAVEKSARGAIEAFARARTELVVRR